MPVNARCDIDCSYGGVEATQKQFECDEGGSIDAAAGASFGVAMATKSHDDAIADAVGCRLETKQLWDKFHQLGTEMIITKSGRYVVKLFGFYIVCVLVLLISTKLKYIDCYQNAANARM